jgi:hypothetical protein
MKTNDSMLNPGVSDTSAPQQFSAGSLLIPEVAVEREVKFAVLNRQLSAAGIHLDRLPKTKIEQHYFTAGRFPELVSLYESRTGVLIPEEIKDEVSQVRIRKSQPMWAGERAEAIHELTMKTPRNSLGLGERIELPPVILSAEEFTMLRAFATAGSLVKDRYDVPTPERFGVSVAIDVINRVGMGKTERSFGRAGWEIMTVDVEVNSPESLRRLLRDPGVVHSFLDEALMLEDYPQLRRSLGATELAKGERKKGGPIGRFERCAREVSRRLERRSR